MSELIDARKALESEEPRIGHIFWTEEDLKELFIFIHFYNHFEDEVTIP